MTSSNAPHLSPDDLTHEPLALRHTNVSNPSVVRNQPSQQSITASEDYYSLSNSSESARSQDTVVHNTGSSSGNIHRYTTPPSRYRTPAQSQQHLPTQSRDNLGTTLGTQYDVPSDEVRKTPMRGHGKRRSTGSSHSTEEPGPSFPAAAVLRQGGITRKPVPSTVMESPDSPRSQEYIDQSGARSSVARDFDHQASPPTPGQDDTPYIRFALDQLTRDEEVRGSRAYPGEGATGVAGPAGVAYAVRPQSTHDRDLQPAVPGAYPSQAQARNLLQQQGSTAYPAVGQAYTSPSGSPQAQARAFQHQTEGYPAGEAYRIGSHPQPTQWRHLQQPQQHQGPSTYPAVGQAYREEAYPQPSRLPDQPRPRSPQPISGAAIAPAPRDIEKQAPMQQRMPDQRPDPFIYVPNDGELHAPLSFLPGILRPLALGLFILLTLILTILLIVSAILSLTHSGLADYGYFGDSKYFTFEYLPTLLGVILFFWIVQIQVAVYRVAPFIAVSSEHPTTREEGARLPIYPKTFLLPYLGHFKAKQSLIGIFMLVAWLQIWTLPLLASSYNVYFYGQISIGQWRWIATQGAIWVVIILYLLLLVSAILLLVWLRKQETGLRWDPRSIADIIVLVERSNALGMSEEEELRHEAPRLGYWRTQRSSHNEIFHSYGVADKPARQYGLGQDGRIREKLPIPPVEPKSRYSDPELEMAREQRHSREKMLPRHTNSDGALEEGGASGGRAIPWFLRPSAALLWAVAAFVLLLAFLIVSYLPSTAVSRGFNPSVPAPIGDLGFSGTNFLYSFVPALIATICLLGWLDIDYAYRRLQPLASLVPLTSRDGGDGNAAHSGELAERSLLLSYTADLPLLATGSAVANKHFRVACTSLTTLIAATLPILGGGCFWAQFFTSTQRVRVSAHMPAYYALTVFLVLYAVACIALVFPSKRMREIDDFLPAGNKGSSFADIVALVRGSRMLDEMAFHGPLSKTDLVTRLLSAEPGFGRSGTGMNPHPPQRRLGGNEAAGASKASLADSVRGFGRAREGADGFGGVGVARYGLGRFEGRDGRDFVGLDRVRL